MKIPGSVSLVKSYGFSYLFVNCPDGNRLEIGSEDAPSKLYGLYPSISNEDIQKFVQNSQIRQFTFHSTRYSSPEQFIVEPVQVLSMFIRAD
jgi:hypothetical protein